MKTIWTVVSGGSLKDLHQIAGKSYSISWSGINDTVLFRKGFQKAYFENELSGVLDRVTFNSAQPTLKVDVESASLVYSSNPAKEKYVELKILITDLSTDEMLWYFVLLSRERSLSSESLPEIISLVKARFPIRAAYQLGMDESTWNEDFGYMYR